MSNEKYVAIAPNYEQFLFWCYYSGVDHTKIVYADLDWLSRQSQEKEDKSLVVIEDWTLESVLDFAMYVQFMHRFTTIYHAYRDTPVVRDEEIYGWKRVRKPAGRIHRPSFKSINKTLLLRLPEADYVKLMAMVISLKEILPSVTKQSVLLYLLRQYNIPVPPQQGETL